MGSKTREGNSFWEQLSLLGLGLSEIFFASLKQVFHSDFSQVAFPLVVA